MKSLKRDHVSIPHHDPIDAPLKATARILKQHNGLLHKRGFILIFRDRLTGSASESHTNSPIGYKAVV